MAHKATSKACENSITIKNSTFLLASNQPVPLCIRDTELVLSARDLWVLQHPVFDAAPVAQHCQKQSGTSRVVDPFCEMPLMSGDAAAPGCASFSTA